MQSADASTLPWVPSKQHRRRGRSEPNKVSKIDIMTELREAETGHAPIREGFLSPDVKIELLVDRWYAWPHLLSPVHQAMNLAFRYLPAIRSFVAAPSVHAAAARQPAMFGGPFVEIDASGVPEMRRYIADVERRRGRALALAQEYRAFDNRLQRAATGHSLDSFQDEIPEALRGFVDLVYDLHSHPKIRLLEEMFEEDDLGHRDAQEILLHRQADRERPFFLSTPRISTDGLFVRSPFDSDGVASLAAARTQIVQLDDLSRLLDTPPQLLANFLTEDKSPSRASRYDGDGVRVRYFGHACLLVETAETSILIDPTAAWDRDPEGGHFSFADFPERIDVLILSHGHQDHLSPEFLVQLRDRVGVVLIPPSNSGDLADPSLRRILRRLGYRRIVTIEPLETFETVDGRITALPFTGEHCDLDVHSKQCVFIELKGRRICCFVDADGIDWEIYRRILPRFVNVDLMFVGMECFGAPLSWLYGPLLPKPLAKRDDDSRRMSGANAARAWQLAEAIRPRQAYVYAMGQEPWMRYLMGLNYHEDSVQLSESRQFVSRCREAGIAAELLFRHQELEL
jgi:L-ascorbate metabolism protein UlaG (beta-lactamase superfamily)